MGRTAADLELVIGLPRTIPAGAGKPTPPLTACGQRRPLAADLLSRKSYEVGSLSSRLCHKVSCAMGGGGGAIVYQVCQQMSSGKPRTVWIGIKAVRSTLQVSLIRPLVGLFSM